MTRTYEVKVVRASTWIVVEKTGARMRPATGPFKSIEAAERMAAILRRSA
jgi:hypothetical protein